MPTTSDLLDAHRDAIRAMLAEGSPDDSGLHVLRARAALLDAGALEAAVAVHAQAVADWIEGRRDATAVIDAREAILRPAPPPAPKPTPPVPDPDALPCGVLRGAYCRPGGCGWCRGYEGVK